MMEEEKSECYKKLEKENEELRQKNHSMQLKLRTTEQTLNSCTLELETLQDDLDRQSAVTNKKHSEDLEILRSKISTMEHKERSSEETVMELEEQLRLSSEQLKEAQNALLNSTVLNESVDHSELHNQIASLTCDKQKLEVSVTQLQSHNEAIGRQVSQLQMLVQQANEDLQESECKRTANYNEMERLKEENMELKEELEMQKLTEKDPKTKGNSLFAEVNDHRLHLEQKMTKMSSAYKALMIHYEEEVAKVSRLRMQVQHLLSTVGSESDNDFITHLNDSLTNYRNQIASLEEEVKDLTARVEGDKQLVLQCVPECCQSRSPFVMNTLELKKKELLTVKRSLQETRFREVVLGDQVLQLQRQLQGVKTSNTQLRAHNVKLKVQLDEKQTKEKDVTEIPVKRNWKPLTNRELNGGHKEKKRDDNKELNEGSEEKKDDNKKRILEELPQNLKTTNEVPLPKAPMSLDTLLSLVKENVPPVSPNKVTKTTPKNENAPPPSKQKKSVRMQETVDVREENGNTTDGVLKSEGNSAGKMKRAPRVMKASPPKEVPKAVEEACKQQ